MKQEAAYTKQVEIERDALRQRVAQLEGDVKEQKRNYLSACETIYKMYVAATGREGVAPKRGVVEDLADLQADHATLLAALKPFAERWEYFERTKHPSGEWPEDTEYADDEPSAIYLGQLKAAKDALSATLPAQPAQGGS